MIKKKIVMIGATGAVGGETVKRLASSPHVDQLTLLGRRNVEDLPEAKVTQHIVDVANPESYGKYIAGHDNAICTLGVGEPSKASKEDFTRIDKEIPIAFANSCKDAGVLHFQLLSSVGVNSASRSFFLRSKGELEDTLVDLKFDRLSLFHPSMILTPTNRYGLSQALTLALWPLLTPLLIGPMEKLRGIKLAKLGAAIAQNVMVDGKGTQTLEWADIVKLADQWQTSNS